MINKKCLIKNFIPTIKSNNNNNFNYSLITILRMVGSSYRWQNCLVSIWSSSFYLTGTYPNVLVTGRFNEETRVQAFYVIGAIDARSKNGATVRQDDRVYRVYGIWVESASRTNLHTVSSSVTIRVHLPRIRTCIEIMFRITYDRNE